MFRSLDGETRSPILTACFLLDRKSKIHLHNGVLTPSSCKVEISFAGTIVLNAELKSTKSTRAYVDLDSRCCIIECRLRDTASSTLLFAL